MIVLADFIHETKYIVLLENGTPVHLSQRQSREQYTLDDTAGWWFSTRVGLIKHVFTALYTDGEKVLFKWGDRVFDLAEITVHKSNHEFRPRFWLTNAVGELILDVRYWYGFAVTMGYIGPSNPDYDLFDLLSFVVEFGNQASWRERFLTR